MQPEFNWTVDLLAEFIKDYSDKEGAVGELMEQFKASKQPKQEWEILSYLSSTYPDRYVIDQNHFGWNNAVIKNMDIHSVKRLSDNTIWTLKDKFSADAGCTLTIKAFEINRKDIKVWSEEYGYWLLNNIRKDKLFTTADGKDIYEGDRVWFVDKYFKIDFYDFIDMGCRENDLKPRPDEYKYFSNEEKAEEYIIWNKPLLTLKEVFDNSGTYDKNNPYFKAIENIAKNKISNQ